MMLKMKGTCYRLIRLPGPPSYRPDQPKLGRNITCTLKEVLSIVLISDENYTKDFLQGTNPI